MKLKNKLLLVIIISLIIQVITSVGFTIFRFLEQSKKSSKEELFSKWHSISLYIENLKHNYLTHIINIRKFFIDNWKNVADTDTIINTIDSFKGNINVDRIIITDKNYRIMADIVSDSRKGFPALNEILAFYSFTHPANKFFYKKMNTGNDALFLITGTHIFGEARTKEFYTVFFIKKIDDSMVTDEIFHELKIDLAIFVNNRFICSNQPYLELPKVNEPDSINLVKTSTGEYYFFSKILSADINKGIYLVVLESIIKDTLYTIELVISFLIAFVITLLISTILATSMTAYFTSPVTELQKWIDDYTKTGKFYNLKIKAKDEVGFLAKTFHSMAKTLIKEEALIKDQLEKITFLNKYNENILKNLQAGIIVINLNGLIEYYNDYISRFLGIGSDEVVMLEIHDFLTSHFTTSKGPNSLKNLDITKNTRIDNIILSKKKYGKYKFIAKVIPIWISGPESKTLIVLEDITNTEKLWEKINQAEKLASLNLLSAGMAHEINNPLGTIVSHVQYLTAIEKDKEKLDSLKWIEKEADRIAEIINRLLDFTRSDFSKVEYSHLNNNILEIIELLNSELAKKKIHLYKSLESKLPLVNLRPGSLKQVIFNLLINAIQAVKDNGEIRISTMKSNSYVYFNIQDNGTGIPKKYLDNIFDPFFTTKKSKARAGLGLSICYNIITKAGGDIHVESIVKKGTGVKIQFPIKVSK